MPYSTQARNNNNNSLGLAVVFPFRPLRQFAEIAPLLLFRYLRQIGRRLSSLFLSSLGVANNSDFSFIQ